MKKFSKTKEKLMKDFYDSIPDEKKRTFAALQSMGLGKDGEKNIATLFGCDLDTIFKGKKELKEFLT